MNKIQKVELVRFNLLIDKDLSPNGCWKWKGSTNKSGQPIFKQKSISSSTQKENISARNYVWILNNKSIKEGYKIITNCGNILCINPNHLKEVIYYVY